MDQIARTTKDLGHVLRQTRKSQNLTQAELASRAGIWQRTVSNIETQIAEQCPSRLADRQSQRHHHGGDE